MSANPTQAYKSRIVIDSHETSNLFRSFNISFNLADEDTTTFDTNGWAEGIRTLNSVQADGEILRKGGLESYSALVDAVLGNSSDHNIIMFMPDGAAVGNQVYVMESFESSHDLGAPVSGVVGGQVSFQNNGQCFLGVVLHTTEGSTDFTGLL